jgi:hypothetical protein
MWDLTSFMIDAKTSHTTSWEVVFFSPWAQRKGAYPKIVHKCNVTN